MKTLSFQICSLKAHFYCIWAQNLWLLQIKISCKENTFFVIIRFVIPVVYIIKLDCSVCICLTQLYDGRDMYRIYYIKNSYMFRPFSLAIFRLINEKLSKQLYSTYVGCIQWGGKGWSGHKISHVLCRMGGVGTCGFCCYMLFWVNIVGFYYGVCVFVFYMYTKYEIGYY